MAIIPNISSGVAGPLGAIHLPRLWSKLRLSAAGQLPEDYPECGAGFDQMVLDGLGVDRDAAVAYVKDNKASYIEFENWVQAQRGGSIPQSEIDASNDAIRGYNTTMILAATSCPRPAWATTARSSMRSISTISTTGPNCTTP